MNGQYILLSIFSFIFIGWQCGSEPYDDPQDQTLFYSSFDTDNGIPSVKGWNLSDSLGGKYIDHSKDNVNYYYYYSLKLQRDSITPYVPNIFTTIINSQSNESKKYFLSFYAKGAGEVVARLKSTGEVRTVVFNVNSVSWKYFNPKTFDCSGNSDTLTVTFSPVNNDTTRSLLLDNVSVQTERR